jgi:hypothetical protein
MAILSTTRLVLAGEAPARRRAICPKGLTSCREAVSFRSPLGHFLVQAEIILLNLRWYLCYPLSYRNLEKMPIRFEYELVAAAKCVICISYESIQKTV